MRSAGEPSLEGRWPRHLLRPLVGASQISEQGGRQHSELNIKQIRSNGSLAPQVRSWLGAWGIPSEPPLSFPGSCKARTLVTSSGPYLSPSNWVGLLPSDES